MTRKRLTLLLVLFATPFACSDPGQVDIGDPIGANLADYAGNWDGYAEAYTFGDGTSDRVRLVMDASGQGTLQVGEAPLLPPPTDPNVGYPVRFSVNPEFAPRLRDDVRYPLRDVTLESKRIRFDVNLFDLYGPWCELQTPVPLAAGGYNCVDDDILGLLPSATSVDPNDCDKVRLDGAIVTVDCAREIMCASWHVCACTASACTANPMPSFGVQPVHLDAALEESGSKLVGTLQVYETTRVTVRMERH